MKDIFDKFKIPTLLGLGVIIVGIIAGVFLVVKEQIFLSQAATNLTLQNITLSNLTDDSATISWQTSTPIASFITFGQTSPDEQTILDDRDTNLPTGKPKAYSIHYVTIKNLLPKTTYQYKIVSGKILSEINKFTTAAPLNSQTGFRPIIGSVLDEDKPLNEGVAYLSIADTATLSSLIKDTGNFLIPLSQIRKADLSDTYPLTEDTTIKLTVISAKGSVNALFKFKTSDNTLPALKIGQDVDLTTQTQKPAIPSDEELNIYDLNNDGKINAADNAIILQNFGKNPQNKKADLNKDGVVDQKDLDLIAKQINQ